MPQAFGIGRIGERDVRIYEIKAWEQQRNSSGARQTEVHHA
jgi:hypothetical protein